MQKNLFGDATTQVGKLWLVQPLIQVAPLECPWSAKLGDKPQPVPMLEVQESASHSKSCQASAGECILRSTNHHPIPPNRKH
eukprot:6475877-Amphidinium_carterae.1